MAWGEERKDDNYYDCGGGSDEEGITVLLLLLLLLFYAFYVKMLPEVERSVDVLSSFILLCGTLLLAIALLAWTWKMLWRW